MAKELLILLDTRAINEVEEHVPDGSGKDWSGKKDVQVFNGGEGLTVSAVPISLPLLDPAECNRLISTYGRPPTTNGQQCG